MFLLVSSSGPNLDTVQKEIEKLVMGNEIRENQLKTMKKKKKKTQEGKRFDFSKWLIEMGKAHISMSSVNGYP